MPAVADHRELADGTVVELNEDSLIDVGFTPTERRVRLLRGEAHFTVVHNAARPFFVTAGNVTVRDVGTAYDVCHSPHSVEVLVTEGSVQINSPGRSPAAASPDAPMLLAGQRAVVPLDGAAAPPQVASVSPAEMERVLAWKPHLLDFFAAPLGEVVAAFNRSNHVQLVIGDRELNALPIVATFRSNNVEGFVNLLEQTNMVKVERRSEGEIVLHRLP